MTDDIRTGREIGDAVTAELERQERPQTWLARQTGINLGTLRRRIAGSHSWTLPELAAVAAALGMSFDTLIRKPPKAA